MKNHLFTRIPFHQTPVTGLRPEQLVNRSFTSGHVDNGALTPRFRLPEFIIQRAISLNEIGTILVIGVDGTTIPVTFDASTDLFYHQDSEYQYAGFKGKDLETELDCGLYYYLVAFSGETTWFYSQYFETFDVSENTVPIGMVKFEIGGDCRVGSIPYDKWDGFKQELWLKADEFRPETTTTRNVDTNEALGEELTSIQISRSNLLTFTCSLGEADLCHAMQAYPMRSLTYYKGIGQDSIRPVDQVQKLEVTETPDFTIDETKPLMRMRVYTSLGEFASSCCSVDTDCPEYTVNATITQQNPNNQFLITIPENEFPSGFWATVMYRRDSNQTFTSVQVSEAQITGGNYFLVVPPVPSDTFFIKIRVENFGDCAWENEEQSFNVG